MNEVRTKIEWLRRGALLGLALASFGLAGCADTTVKGNSGAQATASSDTTSSARSRISKICLLDADKFFGGANNQTRCDCYGDGVSKMLNKDELSYLATYNEIPSISSSEYDKVKQRCLAGGAAPATDKKAADKKPAGKKKANKPAADTPATETPAADAPKAE
jgi:hypothetical protein